MSFNSKRPKGQPDREPKPKVEPPKYNPDKNRSILSDNPAFNPNMKPRNKIKPFRIPSNYKTKNRIKLHTLPPNYKPTNKIEKLILPPKYTPKNKIRIPRLDPQQDNKIKDTTGVKTNQKLYSDGERKECGRCHEIKPHEEYRARNLGGKKVLFSRCKQCRLSMNQIYQYKNKMKIIENAYNGKLNGKCQRCKTDIKRLPSLEFHHSNPKLKGEKGISMYRNWEQTKRQIEKEKATILCVNCHTKQRSKHYNNHEVIIQNNKLNHSSSNNQISRSVKNKLPNADYEVRRQVIWSIKKQIVINHLYGGKCVGCKNVSTKENLPALQFHHRDKENPYKMSKTYVNLRNLEIREIINKLKSDNCIILCGNCHKMEQSSQFKENYEAIVKPEHWDQINKDYEMIEENIKNFTFKLD